VAAAPRHGSALSSGPRIVVREQGLQTDFIEPEKKLLKPSKNRIQLWNGEELQYHRPLPRSEALNLESFVPENYRSCPLEVEIGPGKGEFLAARAGAHPDRYFIGIDRRVDRVRLSEKKLKRLATDESDGRGPNWIVIREDARCFLEAGIPPLDGLHLYQPDPWPKDRQHKHRFFRSPDARAWALALKPGAFFSLSTDHRRYFEEMIDILKTWDFLDLSFAWKKTWLSGPAKTHFEGIFLRQQLPVYKAVFIRRSLPNGLPAEL
jgi:tRNA (guanine-N7-)-methyltransferase